MVRDQWFEFPTREQAEAALAEMVSAVEAKGLTVTKAEVNDDYNPDEYPLDDEHDDDQEDVR